MDRHLPTDVTIRELAALLKVSTKTVERGLASGLFLPTKVRGSVRLDLERNLARVDPPRLREPREPRQRLRAVARS